MLRFGPKLAAITARTAFSEISRRFVMVPTPSHLPAFTCVHCSVCPVFSMAYERYERGGYVAFGNTAERANDVVLGRRGRGVSGFFNRGDSKLSYSGS